TTSRDGHLVAVSSCERLLLDRVVLSLGYRAAVEELLRALDLRGGAAARGVAHVLVELCPRGLAALEIALGHPGALCDQIDEDTEVGEHDREDDPPGLPPAGEIVAAKDVREDREEEPKPNHPEEEDGHRPDNVEKRVVRCEHSRLLGNAWGALPSHAAHEKTKRGRLRRPLEQRHARCSELADLRIGIAGLGEDLGRVLTEARWRGSVRDAIAIGGEGQADRAESGELLKDPQRQRLFALGDLGHILHRSGRHAGLAQPPEPYSRALELETPLQRWDQLTSIRDTERIRRKAGVVSKAWEPNDLAQRAKEPVVSCHDHQLPVPGAEHLVWDDQRKRRALAGGDLARSQVVR